MNQIDAAVSKSMLAFSDPGAAVGIVKEHATIYQRELEQGLVQRGRSEPRYHFSHCVEYQSVHCRQRWNLSKPGFTRLG
jgi:hypothetical protein